MPADGQTVETGLIPRVVEPLQVPVAAASVRVLARLLVLFLAFAVSVLAAPLSEEVTLTIHAFPACQVYLDGPLGLSYLGRSGEMLRVAPPMLRDPQGRPAQYAGGALVLRCERHADLRVPVAAQEWASGRLPSVGEFSLPAASWTVAAADRLGAHPLLWGGAALFAALAGRRAWRWRRKAHESDAQSDALESLRDTHGDPLIGKHIGRYRVDRRLGKGGMGAVYRVVDDGGGVYAAKVIYFDEDEDTLSIERFRREYRLLAQLRSPAFPRCFDYIEREGMAAVIMELVAGRTLRAHLSPTGLPWETCRPWIRRILEALEAAHECGIVHRDLKPDNIMVAGDDLRILDFGLARQRDGVAVTMTGEAMGTPGYMAPEQLEAGGSQVDRRTDLYSLGIILYELLSGSRPFRGKDLDAVVIEQLSRPAPTLDVPGLPRGLSEIVAVLLETNPANRYATARRVLDLIDGIDAGTSAEDTVGV